jgi:A/G-specific adenine glycosylase
MAGSNRHSFTSALMHWHASANDRSLPWKNEKDPYRIWLSEVILQQTRAQQGLPYYLRFIAAYPTVKDMALAQDDEAFRLWQGLGYYNRCKNMLATARLVANEFDGHFPTSHDGLLALKGIGPYTAAAIASFAYGLPHAVVDGNVYRVLARYFGIDTPFDTTTGKRQFAQLAQQLLNARQSAAYNQAIMDLGATVCTPRSPLCGECPLGSRCIARKQDMIALLPVKSKKLTVKKRYFNYLLLLHKGKVWIRKRTGNDIWQNLHEPYLIETAAPLTPEQLTLTDEFKRSNIRDRSLTPCGTITQRLTHQLIQSTFYTIHITKNNTIPDPDGYWIDIDNLKSVSFPKTLVSFLEKNLYF